MLHVVGNSLAIRSLTRGDVMVTASSVYLSRQSAALRWAVACNSKHSERNDEVDCQIKYR